jgi:hypothetical protein
MIAYIVSGILVGLMCAVLGLLAPSVLLFVVGIVLTAVSFGLLLYIRNRHRKGFPIP